MNQPNNQAAIGFSIEDLDLLSYLLEQDGLGSDAQQSIPRRTGLTRAPLSYSQQRLWSLDQLQPATPVYNSTSAVKLKGKLNVVALQQTLSEIVRRHDSLRTTFAMDRTQPVQVIHEQQSVPSSL